MKLLEKISKYSIIDEVTEDFFRNETQTKTFQKGELLSQQNTYNRNVYYMEKGLARTFYFEKGKDITTNFYSEEKSFANIDTVFNNVPSYYNIETLEESIVTFCDYKKLEELCSISLPSANFSRFLLGNLMTQMTKRINSLQHMTAKEKYIQLLEENPNIILRAPLGMIATYLGISQETLSRIRSEI
ncbi:Crp/Fnr family transcriptional regulator [Frigoriflavimonas asaccharolytica]|uniref:CRP-like cAMP-binding protein n=1 Tax=Frigoriflavimonas asaccharolytica TaxID=2735899 RepID=A0A8J8G6V9_9FLAO|nr:Crp/Fnr family transcriptional regulator [Frigoriflavimonas asaccharolytica]NRS91077.1 CRP-like cAMP-binding protein [Frigoriflavimonas asaccharolytica]